MCLWRVNVEERERIPLARMSSCLELGNIIKLVLILYFFGCTCIYDWYLFFLNLYFPNFLISFRYDFPEDYVRKLECVELCKIVSCSLFSYLYTLISVYIPSLSNSPMKLYVSLLFLTCIELPAYPHLILMTSRISSITISVPLHIFRSAAICDSLTPLEWNLKLLGQRRTRMSKYLPSRMNLSLNLTPRY